MARKRDGLVPIEEALADLGGPVKALRKTPPPARRGFLDGNQLAALTLHDFILPCASRQGSEKKEALADADLQPNTDLPKALKGLPDFG